jgi:hypothetical protein
LQDEYKSTLNKINDEHSKQLSSINSLQNKLNDYIMLIKTISEELRDQKIELNSNFEKYLNNMENEKKITIEKYKSDMNTFIENRVKIFKKYLENQMNK